VLEHRRNRSLAQLRRTTLASALRVSRGVQLLLERPSLPGNHHVDAKGNDNVVTGLRPHRHRLE